MAAKNAHASKFSLTVFKWHFGGRNKEWLLETADAPTLRAIVSPAGSWVAWGFDKSGSQFTWAGPADGIAAGKACAEQAVVILRYKIELADKAIDRSPK